MGAIQQAFNQALAISAMASGPEAMRQKHIHTAEKTATQAENQAIDTEYKRFNKDPISGTALDVLGDKDLLNPEEPQLLIDRYADTAKTAYEINPTAANRDRYSVAMEWVKTAKQLTTPGEDAAQKAASQMTNTKAQKKEQNEIMAQFMSNIPQSYPIKEVIK